MASGASRRGGGNGQTDSQPSYIGRRPSDLRNKLTRWSLFGIGGVSLLMLVIAAAIFWRLTMGPISLGLLSGPVERLINSGLEGMHVEIDDAVIERSADTGRPTVRLRNVRLKDLDGRLMAQSPRASVGIDGAALLTGSFVARRLELIGPHIRVHRRPDGGLELGFGGTGSLEDDGNGTASYSEDGEVTIEVEGEHIETAGDGFGALVTLTDILEREVFATSEHRRPGHFIESVMVSEATISLYDEGNHALWFAPDVNLNFQRAPQGVTLIADARIASGIQPWRIELAVTHRLQQGLFSISARIHDLLPADISNQIFMLAELAEVRLPLSGEVQIELTDDGEIQKAGAVFSAAAGFVGFPDFISNPILVDEGVLRLTYAPDSGDIIISDSAIFIGPTQAELSGRIGLVLDDDNRLGALDITLDARDVGGGAPGIRSASNRIDHISFSGLASVAASRLDVRDLLVMAGDGGVRLRGSFEGGENAVAIRAGGRIRNLPVEVLKQVWPPIVAPGAREWVNENVIDGTMSDGEMVINLPADVLAAALLDNPIPDEHVHFAFTLTDVSTRYFEDLPIIRGGKGQAVLRGNDFHLELESGHVDLPSGHRLDLTGGTMNVSNLVRERIFGEFRISANGPAQGMLELLDHEPLNFVQNAGFQVAALEADVTADVHLAMPLLKELPEDALSIAADVRLEQIRLPAILDDISLTGGSVSLNVNDDRVMGEGEVLFNDIPARLTLEVPFDDEEGLVARNFRIEATLTDEQRKTLGADIAHMITGPVDVTVTTQAIGDTFTNTRVEADLSEAWLMMPPIAWRRQPTPGTQATFGVVFGENGETAITDIDITGDGVRFVGNITIDAEDRISRIRLPVVQLGRETSFSVNGSTGDDGVLALEVSGETLDARPLLATLFADDEPDFPRPDEDDTRLSVSGRLERIIGYRGEALSDARINATGRGPALTTVDFTGAFVSGGRMNVRISPGDGGERHLNLETDNAGAALRAVNLYSRVAGGGLSLRADLGPPGSHAVRNGRLVMRQFTVQDEPVLTRFDRDGQPVRGAPRGGAGSLHFTRLTVPFSVNSESVLIGDSLLQGAAIGGSAQGRIRKRDGRLDIGGTIIPAYAVNSLLGAVPVLGEVLTGGRGQGIFGITFAVSGTLEQPDVTINPVSALAPGFLRRLFEFGGGGVNPDGSARERPFHDRETLR